LIYGNSKEYRLYSAVVMPDHVHILIQPLNKGNNEWFDLATIMKKIKGISARKINQIRKTSGSIWSSESYDRIIRNDEEMKEKWNYIVTNPVRAGLVSDIDDYPFVIKGYD